MPAAWCLYIWQFSVQLGKFLQDNLLSSGIRSFLESRACKPPSLSPVLTSAYYDYYRKYTFHETKVN